MSVEMNVFNASITVTELLTKTLENCAKELASRCIKECAARHGFDAESEIRMLGLENLSLIKKQMAKKAAGSKKEKAVKTPKTKAPKEKKASFPLPFTKDSVNISGCQGLAYNKGLFTQCDKKRMEEGEFCNKCQTEADKNASGAPDCGTVCDRIAADLYDFKDPKGRSPARYVKVLEKLKLNETDAMAEANKLNIVLDSEHFVAGDNKKTKGRPKKTSSVVKADNVTDLIAKLVADDVEDDIEEEKETVVEKKPVKKVQLSEEEKAEKKAQLEAKKAAEKAEKEAEREAKKAAEKAEKEAKKAVEKAVEKAEREAKKAAEKAEKEAKKAAEKAEKEAKKAAEKAEKPPKKAVEKKAAEQVAEQVAKKETAKASQFIIEGKMFYKTPDNVLYDSNTKQPVGFWNAETKEIEELPDEDDEEEEDEYDEDDN
jgi:hypothetical protein